MDDHGVLVVDSFFLVLAEDAIKSAIKDYKSKRVSAAAAAASSGSAPQQATA